MEKVGEGFEQQGQGKTTFITDRASYACIDLISLERAGLISL